MGRFQCTVMWQRLDEPGTEYCTMAQHDDGWRLSGTVHAVLHDRPLQVNYGIICTPTWQTLSTDVAIETGSTSRVQTVAADSKQSWSAAGIALPFLQGCVDIDLSVTPATNTLVVRRLDLPIGASQEVTAAWMHFPSLTVRPLRQKYTRLDQYRYLYESGGSAFTAEIEVDDAGLVTRYGKIWTRVGTSKNTSSKA